MADTEKLLDRVRKLLALAESPNVHEAAAAAARAQAIIEEHRLQSILDRERAEEALQEGLDDGRDQPLEAARRIRKWKSFLAARLAELNGCVAYTAGARGDQKLLLAGHPDDRAAVLEIWSWLVHRIETLSATHGPGQDRRWHDAFRIGAAETVAAGMAASRAGARAKLGATALVRVEPALARRTEAVRAYARERLHLRQGRGLRVDADGYARGQVAGRDVEV